MSAALSPPRVLLVDDDPAFAELIKCVLTLEGVDVVGHARDGAEGVELTSRLQPDIVLMDVRMPRMDGLEATRRIVESNTAARVLVVSSSTDPEDVTRAREAGADGYLPKEHAAAELGRWLEALRPLGAPPPRPLWNWRVLELGF